MKNLKMLFYRPIKYILSIIISGLIIGFIVLSTMIFTTNYPKKQVDYIYERNKENYLRVEGEFSNSDVKKLKEGIDVDVLSTYGIFDNRFNFNILNFIPLPTNVFDKDDNILEPFKKVMIYEENNSFFSLMNLKFGSWPKNQGEVVIPDYYFRFFENLGYVYNNELIDNNGTSTENKISISAKQIKTNPEIIIGKKIDFFNHATNDYDYYNFSLKITGVLNTSIFDDEEAMKNNFIAKSGLFGCFILNNNDFSTILQANELLPINIDDDKIFNSVFINIGKEYNTLEKTINLLSLLDVGSLTISTGINSSYSTNSKNRVILYNDINVTYNVPDSYIYNDENEIIGYSFATNENKTNFRAYIYPNTINYQNEIYIVDFDYPLSKFKTSGIVLFSVAIFLILVYLIMIIPYFRDGLYENDDFYLESVNNKTINKKLLVQYFSTFVFTFIVSLIVILTSCIIKNNDLGSSSYYSIYSNTIITNKYHYFRSSALNPLNLTILYLLLTFLLSFIISAIGFIYLKIKIQRNNVE